MVPKLHAAAGCPCWPLLPALLGTTILDSVRSHTIQGGGTWESQGGRCDSGKFGNSCLIALKKLYEIKMDNLNSGAFSLPVGLFRWKLFHNAKVLLGSSSLNWIERQGYGSKP